MTPLYSIVIPLKNEAGNILGLIDEVEMTMNPIGSPWELICIDDGSTDETPQILENLTKKKPYLRAIIFDKNYGQSSAFESGFKAAGGEFVITLDGDGQNDPKDIPKLIDLIADCDMVSGVRMKRKDRLSKKWISKIANAVRGRLCDDGVQDTGCSLKIYRKSCLDKIKMYNGMHRFLPALFKIEEFRIKETPVSHRPRLSGKSNYHFFNRSFNTVADLLAVSWMKKRKLRYKIDRILSSKT